MEYFEPIVPFFMEERSMIEVAISMPGRFYGDAITKALEQTGNFRVRVLDENRFIGDGGAKSIECSKWISAGGFLETRHGPDVALLGVSVVRGYTLGDRENLIRKIRENASECRIVLFLDEEVSREQTDGVKSLKQAKVIDGFLYASGTMDYLVATLESI